jgi:signal transduction histidine kinase
MKNPAFRKALLTLNVPFLDEGLEEMVARAHADDPDAVREAFREIEQLLIERSIHPEDRTILAAHMSVLAESSSSKTRERVALLLRYVSRDEAEPTLQKLLNDDNDLVTKAARRADNRHTERELIGYLPSALDGRATAQLDAIEKKHTSKARLAAIRFGLSLTERTVESANHQLKNALSPVGSYLEQLSLQIEQSEDLEKMRASVVAARSQLKIASGVLDQALKYVTRTPPAYRKVGLRAIVETALVAIRHVPPLPAATEDFQINVDDKIELDAGADLLLEALVNVLKNAVEASPSDRPVNLIVNAKRTRGRVVIEIKDAGCGMTLEECEETIWRPYGSRKKGGTGLGMPLAKKFIEVDHGGTITVKSDAQGFLGTTVTITLPLVQDR